jgi:hypothetical protein
VVRIEKNILGTTKGGGLEIQFKNFTGITNIGWAAKTHHGGAEGRNSAAD